MAEFALGHYDFDIASFSLLAYAFNTTYTVVDRASCRYVLHILRPDPSIAPDRARTRVQSELWWLDRLAGDASIQVPQVVHDRTGNAVVEIATDGKPPLVCTLFRWIPGRFYASPSPRQLRQVGRLTAHLHNQSSSLSVPDWFDRPRVDPADVSVEERVATSFGDRYSPQAARIMRAAFRHIRVAQDTLAGQSDTFGLIHADIHQKNYLFDRGLARLIDFGDAGWGFHLYDLGVTIQQLFGAPNLDTLRAALLAGYREVRDLSTAREAMIDAFMMIREIQDLAWILGERDNPAYQSFVPQLDRGLAWLATIVDEPVTPATPRGPAPSA